MLDFLPKPTYSDYMNRRVAVRAIIVHDSKLLCVRQKKYQGSLTEATNQYWNVPGGGLEEGEALTDGVCREIIEETGITPKLGNLLYVQQFAYVDMEFLEFFFHVSNGDA